LPYIGLKTVQARQCINSCMAVVAVHVVMFNRFLAAWLDLKAVLILRCLNSFGNCCQVALPYVDKLSVYC
jgi:hypothetical protein